MVLVQVLLDLLGYVVLEMVLANQGLEDASHAGDASRQVAVEHDG